MTNISQKNVSPMDRGIPRVIIISLIFELPNKYFISGKVKHT